MTLKEKIDRLNKKVGIKTYTELLRKIYSILKCENIYEKVKKEKSNFTQMLEGNRSLNKEYYIPLEQIYHVPIIDILYGDLEPNISFRNCGLRYTASTNNYDEFDRLGNEFYTENSHVIFNSDEYNKSIFDYIVEYEATEGLRYLLDKFGIKYDLVRNLINSKNNLCYCFDETTIKIFKMLLERDESIFTEIFDSYDLLLGYNDERSVYKNSDYMEMILRSSVIFDSLFTVKEFLLSTINYGLQNHDNDVSLFVNPLLNILLAVAMEKPDIYKDQIERIIDFAITKNEEVVDFIISHFNNLDIGYKINEKGYVLLGHTKYGLIINPGDVINPSIEGWLKSKISKVKQINDKLIYHDVKDYFGNNHKITSFNEKGHILKLSSKNELEYLLHKKYESILPIPKYYGTYDGIDEFENYRGKPMSYGINVNIDCVAEIAKFLKLLHNVTMNKEGQVYVHGEIIVDNFYFSDNKLTDVINWDNVKIGDTYEDMINLLINLSGMKERYRDNKSVLDCIRKIFNEYEATEYYKRFCLEKLKSHLNNLIESFDTHVFQSDFERIHAYENYLWCKSFIDMYFSKILE